MDVNKKSSAKCGDVLHKSSSVLSFISMLLVVALCLRMESINRKTEMNELRITNVERRIKIRSPQTTDHKDEMEMPENPNTKVRRSLISVSNKSLTIEDVRSEITKQVNKLNTASLCQPMEKVCVPGPPGKKGSRGSRGRRGAQGAKGKKGDQGIMGLPGRHGKQGIMGTQGTKGEKGEKGAIGPRGIMGLKGDPGESISSPEISVSPETQTVTENQTATFYCSASGNPKPVVTWSKVNGSLGDESVSTNDGKLIISKSSYNQTGKYICTAINALGRDQKITNLFVEVYPKLTKVPDRSYTINEGATANITCEAFGVPPPVIQWTRPLFALPKGRSSVSNGSLSIEDFRPEDTGTYTCSATNKLGSTSTLTALGIHALETVCFQTEGARAKSDGIYHANYPTSTSKYAVYCDMTAESRGWILIARFSNSDSKTWMSNDGLWWYDQQAAMGTTTDPFINTDMISPAFSFVHGREFKITRSDDPSHTPLLQTTSNCLAGQTFRSKITSYGDFRNGKVWASDKCLGSCTVQYGGQYKSTDGFQQAECSGDIQSANKIGFWCHWSSDGSVMMIGGGGSACSRADHGIGITETGSVSFVEESSQREHDFGYCPNLGNCLGSATSQSYSLNLWIR
ncbi:hypothetical protein ACROYT_G031401 [Oculina patagonica]